METIEEAVKLSACLEATFQRKAIRLSPEMVFPYELIRESNPDAARCSRLKGFREPLEINIFTR